jgi:hypothetical protein
MKVIHAGDADDDRGENELNGHPRAAEMRCVDGLLSRR